ncbi:MFS transporter [Streptomyces odontomachi]|uniref:MFS transporter n=1 Tax=Streptomyces odontomachi TaxID=2944940 RepID=UPI00210EAF7F|nr:MFS transporter [Streptomyces sp. ODS25]
MSDTPAPTARTSPDGPAGSGGGRAAGTVTLAVICGAQMMFLLDTLIVTIALPRIQAGLHFSGPQLEWVQNAYTLVFGGLLLLGGRAGDVFGRRRVFVIGLVLFTVASLTAGLAQAPWQLIVSRGVQAVGAAAASPATLSLLATAFAEGPLRDRAVSIYAALGTAGGGVGLLVGGLITSFLSWRWIMLVNVPIGAVILAAAPRVLRDTDHRPGRGFDVSGALTGTLGMTMLVLALTRAAADSHGVVHWAEPTVLGALGCAAVLMAVFVAVEHRSAQPLVPLHLFADRARLGTYVTAVLYSMAMVGISFFITLFVQRVWEYSPLNTALVFLPMQGLLVAGARAGGPLMRLLGTRTLLTGALAMAVVGMVWLSRLDADGGYLTDLLGPSSLMYAGLGMVGTPLMVGALAGVDERTTGIASGVFTCARQIGGAIGLALLGTVTWTTVAADRTPSGDQALADGVDRGFLVASVLTALALVVAVTTAVGRRKETPVAQGTQDGEADATS